MGDTENQEPFLIPPWLAWTFWIAYLLHGVCSAGLRDWFSDPRGNTWGIIRFFLLSLSYTVIGATFHAACKIVYSRVARGTLLTNVPATVNAVIKESAVAAFLIWLLVAQLAIGTELGWEYQIVRHHLQCGND
jgi:hypothetical protein